MADKDYDKHVGWVKDDKGREEWTSEHGVVRCTLGVYSDAGDYTTDGATSVAHKASPSSQLRVAFDGKKLEFVNADLQAHDVPPQATVVAFALASADTAAYKFSFRCTENRVGDPFDVEIDGRDVHVQSTRDTPENAITKATVGGEVPVIVTITCTLLSRVKEQIRRYVEKHTRSFHRCGALCLKKSAPPLLCPECQPKFVNVCFVCSSSGASAEGWMCKQCSTHRFRCARCAEPCGTGAKVEGRLCGGCATRNCCRLLKELEHRPGM